MEKASNLTVKGKNENGNFEVTCEGFFGIAARKKTVIIGKVIKGIIDVGDEILLVKGENNSMSDIVKEIQIDKTSYPRAVAGESIGICLGNSKLRYLRRFIN
jgi:selenocysteine-specific translation elongation factor